MVDRFHEVVVLVADIQGVAVEYRVRAVVLLDAVDDEAALLEDLGLDPDEIEEARSEPEELPEFIFPGSGC
ncbi:hypothetical protein GWK26_00625 [haloarchaeon 3A1-DGR]|nr:hypothetical protein GWK26_00625 [haloarchaeon 3A1-DGR]